MNKTTVGTASKGRSYRYIDANETKQSSWAPTMGGTASKRGAMATISHAIPDVMNQNNIGSVIGMLQTAEGLLD